MPCAASAPTVEVWAIDKLSSGFVTLAPTLVKAPSGGDNSKTPAGANVNSITTSPYKLVSIIDVDALPPRIPNH